MGNIDSDSTEVEHTRDSVLETCKKNWKTLRGVSKEFREDKSLYLEILGTNPKAVGILEYAPGCLKRDVEFFEKILDCLDIAEMSDKNDKTPSILQFCAENVKDNRRIVLRELLRNPFSFKYVSEQYKNERKIVLQAVRRNGDLLKYSTPHMKNDQEVVLAAIESGCSLEYLGEKAIRNKDIVLSSFKRRGYGGDISIIDENLQNDEEICIAAIQSGRKSKKYPMIITLLSKEMKSSRNVAIAAVRKNWKAVQALPEELSKDPNILLEIVKKDGCLLYNIISNVSKQHERSIFSRAIQNTGKVLKFLRTTDMSLVKLSIFCHDSILHGSSLAFTHPQSLARIDPDVVLFAISKCSEASVLHNLSKFEDWELLKEKFGGKDLEYKCSRCKKKVTSIDDTSDRMLICKVCFSPTCQECCSKGVDCLNPCLPTSGSKCFLVDLVDFLGMREDYEKVKELVAKQLCEDGMGREITT